MSQLSFFFKRIAAAQRSCSNALGTVRACRAPVLARWPDGLAHWPANPLHLQVRAPPPSLRARACAWLSLCARLSVCLCAWLSKGAHGSACWGAVVTIIVSPSKSFSKVKPTALRIMKPGGRQCSRLVRKKKRTKLTHFKYCTQRPGNGTTLVPFPPVSFF